MYRLALCRYGYINALLKVMPLLPAPLGCPVVSAATTPEARLDDSRYSRLGGFALESH